MKTLKVLLIGALVFGTAGIIGCGDTADDTEDPESTALQLEDDADTEVATTKDQRDISYRVIGSGDQDVVLVHGWMVSGVAVDQLAEELDSSEYRVLVPDLRGTGASDKPNAGYDIQPYLHDVEAVIDDADADDVILGGHSMGGAIAQKYAAQNADQIAGLVLMSPVPASGFPLPEEDYQFFKASADDPEIRRIILHISSVDMDDADFVRLAESSDEIPPKAIEQSLDAWVDADFEDILGNIEAPTRVLVSDDPFMPAPFLEATVVDPIPDASLSYFGGAGHYLQVEMPGETASEFEAFADTL